MHKPVLILIAVDVPTAGSYSINEFFSLFRFKLPKTIVSKDKVDPIGPTTLFSGEVGEMWAVGHKDPEKGQQKWNTKRSSFQPVAEATREKQHKIRTAMFVSKFIIKQKKKK